MQRRKTSKKSAVRKKPPSKPKDGGYYREIRARIDVSDKTSLDLLDQCEAEFLKMFENVAKMYAINIEVQKTNALLTAELRSIHSQVASMGRVN